MDADQPGLFDLPGGEPPVSHTRGRRGRNRETWVRTATAEVTVVDEQALLEAREQAEERGYVIELEDARGPEAPPHDVDRGVDEPDEADEDGVFDALAWLIWPTDGMDGPLEADAFRVLEVGSEVEMTSSDRAEVTWTAIVRLTDVDALRRLAARAHPAEAGAIDESLELAWQYAADPFAPIGSVPGITWHPGHVEVRHLRRRG